ncbi:DUF2180 family protein [Streptomyces sp. ISL-10]|uniref:DUF2180 family protein n=1 Tax=Streptomyces sp. ISL-10 TaxID=2819172 RepID=UPI001BE6F7EB|nr:DUF2180 family protein [Streptomyces sp. ISL-10]MBT2367273.1 DUF2180 family protein [Streptomyces sp. ISL-10]
MDCYDCHSLKRATTAVAVCHRCGVALCSEHLYIETQEIHRDRGLGKSTSDIPARFVVCSACRRAEESV